MQIDQENEERISHEDRYNSRESRLKTGQNRVQNKDN